MENWLKGILELLNGSIRKIEQTVYIGENGYHVLAYRVRKVGHGKKDVVRIDFTRLDSP